MSIKNGLRKGGKRLVPVGFTFHLSLFTFHARSVFCSKQLRIAES
jgi:hypothetical protein